MAEVTRPATYFGPSFSDREIREAALRLPAEWLVEDVCDALGATRLLWGTYVWHIVRDLVDEGLVTRRWDGFYEVVESTTGGFCRPPKEGASMSEHTDPELQALRDVLRRSHPSFVGIDDTLMRLAADEAISPANFDLICKALFTVLMAYADERNAREAAEAVSGDSGEDQVRVGYPRGAAMSEQETKRRTS